MVLGAGRGFCMVNVGRANGGLLRGIEGGLLSLARVVQLQCITEEEGQQWLGGVSDVGDNSLGCSILRLRNIDG